MANQLKETHTLSANERKPVYFHGRMIIVRSVSGQVDIARDDEQPVRAFGGQVIGGPESPIFKRINLEEKDGAAATIEIYASDDDIDSIETIISSTITAKGGDTHGGGVETVGTAAVEIVAADADRNRINVQADSDNTADLYLGTDNTVSTANAFARLAPGQSWHEETGHAVWAISTAAAQKARWSEVKD